jgi:glycosyltransferase involved in cell wall biosynthesis
MLRVLQSLSCSDFGGTERMVSHLASAMPADVELEVSVLAGWGPVCEALRSRGVTVHVLNAHRRSVRALLAYRALLSRGRFDIVHLYGLGMSLVGRIAARTLARRPRVVHGVRGLHLTDWPELDSLRLRAALRLERSTSWMVDRYVANSASALAYLTAHGLPADRFTVVPNGLDTTFWRPDPGVIREDALIVTVANFRPVKRLELLLEALVRLNADSVRFRAMLVGDGPLRSALSERILALGLDRCVEIAGPYTAANVRTTLSRATVFVLPSAWEGMPVSVMEAMSCGVPVVGTDVPGIRDIVVQEVTGLLANPTPRDLADAIGRVLLDAPLARELGGAGSDRIRQEYGVDRMASGYERVYRSLLDA